MVFERPKYVVGFDLRDDACQMSYMTIPAKRPPKIPATFSLVPGKELFDIPTAIAKKEGSAEWSCGPDAAAVAADEKTAFVPNLLTLALEGNPVQVGNEQYEPGALLALFVSRCLAMLGRDVPMREVGILMFTAREMTDRMIAVLEDVRRRIALECRVCYESYATSFYNYLLFQADTVREPASALVEYQQGGQVRIGRMQYNLRTKPMVAYYEEHVYPGLFAEEGPGRDAELGKLLREEAGRGRFVSAYLIGNGLTGGWAGQSIAWLCRGRRVFMGNNLYSKGATYGAFIKQTNPPIADLYYFLDGNRLTANIGIRAFSRGEEVYHPILDAGTNWYEADVTTDLLLEDLGELHLILTPLTGGKVEETPVRLERLPVREGRITRIRLQVTMSAPDKVELHLEDLGFGEIFPSTGLKWEQTITIHKKEENG